MPCLLLFLWAEQPTEEEVVPKNQGSACQYWATCCRVHGHDGDGRREPGARWHGTPHRRCQTPAHRTRWATREAAGTGRGWQRAGGMRVSLTSKAGGVYN